MQRFKQKVKNFLIWSQKYTGTDMLYLAKGSFWLSSAQTIMGISNFVLAIALANLLPKESFGTYKFIISLSGILAIFTLQGINRALIQGVARGYEGIFIPALKTRIRWGILGQIATLGLAGYYYSKANITLTICFLIVALFLPLTFSFESFLALLQGRKRFDLYAKYKVTVQILSVASLIGMVFLTSNIFILILTYFISLTLFRFIMLWRVLKKHPLNQKKDPRIISFGKHLSLMGVISPVAAELDKILLWHFLGAVPLALYSLSLIIPRQIRNTISQIGQLALPKLSQKKFSLIKATLPKKVIKFLLIMIPLFVIYIISAPFIYKIIFPAYPSAARYSQIFAISLLLTPQILFSTSLAAHLKKKELYILNLVNPSVKIILFLALLPLWGIWGAIWSLLISQSLGLGLAAFLFKRAS